MTSKFVGNTYVNLSMGIMISFDANYSRGCLFKFFYTPSIDFIGESYLNIGAFTLEHLNQIIALVKNE